LKRVGTNTRSSWASIAKKNSNAASIIVQPKPTKPLEKRKKQYRQPNQRPQVTSFADAVVSRKHEAQTHPFCKKEREKICSHSASSTYLTKKETKHISVSENKQNSPYTKLNSEVRFSSNRISNRALEKMSQIVGSLKNTDQLQKERICKTEPMQKIQNKTVFLDNRKLTGAPSLFPQGSNDVLEVLCSGETTAGKLLMHFLLYYGEHFDSRTTAIDVIGSCNLDYSICRASPPLQKSPFVIRRSGGTIDPVTGMLTVDPIVIYDPWEGGRGNNVARSCYAWNSIRWHFGQCYMTLSSAIERSLTTPQTASMMTETVQKHARSSLLASSGAEYVAKHNNCKTDSSVNKNYRRSNSLGLEPPVDMVSPLLELLLSF